MKYPTVKIVFDRKKESSKTRKGLIQIVFQHERVRKYLSTDIKVYKGEFKEGKNVISRLDMMELNERINLMYGRCIEFVNTLIRNKEEFTWSKFESWKENFKHSESFLMFLERRISERTDITESSRRNQRKIISSLSDFGKMETFDDVNRKGIAEYDIFLHSKYKNTNTIRSYHKTLHTYTNMAYELELIKSDPYNGFKMEKGKPNIDNYLTKEQIDMMYGTDFGSAHINKVRDVATFQFYTGLAYADLKNFDFSKVTEKDGTYIIMDKRVKTGKSFCITIHPKAMEILQRYDFQLPIISNQKYNDYLKVIGVSCGFHKKVTSHTFRHSFAMWSLNKGIPVEVVARMMGHSTPTETLKTYSKVLPDTVSRWSKLLSD